MSLTLLILLCAAIAGIIVIIIIIIIIIIYDNLGSLTITVGKVNASYNV